MTEAVKDGITVNLVYDGRAAKVMLNQDKVRQIEEYYAQCELCLLYTSTARTPIGAPSAAIPDADGVLTKSVKLLVGI